MIQYPYTYEVCDPKRRGQLAGRKFLFGEYKRFAVAPLHSRFGELFWAVWDAGQENEPDTGLPPIIRIEPTFAQAVHGLTNSGPHSAGPVFTHNEPGGAAGSTIR